MAHKASYVEIFLCALAPIIWGTSYILTSEFLPPDRPYTAAMIRCLPAGIILLAYGRSFPKAGEYLKLFCLAFLNIGVFQALLFIAAYRLPGGLAALLGAIQPLLIMLFAWSIDAKKPKKLVLAASLMAVLGMALLLLSPKTVWDSRGVAAALVAACSMAVGTFLNRHWKTSLPVISFTGWQLILGGIMLAPIAVWFDPALPSLTVKHVAAYSYLCLVSGLLAYSLWFRGLVHLNPVAASALGLLSPLCAVLLGWLFLGQSMSGMGLFGMLLVLVNVMLIQVAQNENSIAFLRSTIKRFYDFFHKSSLHTNKEKHEYHSVN